MKNNKKTIFIIAFIITVIIDLAYLTFSVLNYIGYFSGNSFISKNLWWISLITLIINLAIAIVSFIILKKSQSED